MSTSKIDFGAIKMIMTVGALSVVRFAYTRSLVPLYATAPTEYLLNKIITGTLAVSVMLPPQWRPDPRLLLAVAGIWLTASPIATHELAVFTARYKDPVWGPAVVHGLVIVPIVFSLVTYGIENMAASPGVLASLHPLAGRAAIAYVSYQSLTTLPQLWEQLPYLTAISDSTLLLTVAGAVVICWIISAARPSDTFQSTAGPPLTPKGRSASNKKQDKAQTKKVHGLFTASDAKYGVLFGLWLTFAPTLCRSPVLEHPVSKPYTHPTAPLRILSSVQSNTGLIVVAEALPDSTVKSEMSSLRYLRASHSLLGGVWVGDKAMTIDGKDRLKDAQGHFIGDSIYSAFVLQEAARLARPVAAADAKPDSALIIGLGAGISATAFSRHNMSVTIVEIDPAVYDAARTYFGLPDPGQDNVFLTDARGWVYRQTLHPDTPRRSYDIVVHDCFSGGGVPEYMFSTEFWQDLKRIMSPNGVVAINFAGKPDSQPSRAILHTLENTFGECRAFHDMFGELPEAQYQTEFVNIVFFCSSSPKPLAFRSFIPADALNSPLRQHVLRSLASREINLEILRETESTVLTDEHNLLGEWQQPEAMHHWALMREVLDNVHWETY